MSVDTALATFEDMRKHTYFDDSGVKHLVMTDNKVTWYSKNLSKT